MELKYGDILKKYPLEKDRYYSIYKGDVFAGRFGTFHFSDKVHSELLPDSQVDLIYSDPTWDRAQVNQFRRGVGLAPYTKAQFDSFIGEIINTFCKYTRQYLCLQWGKRTADEIKRALEHCGFRCLGEWENILVWNNPANTVHPRFMVFTKDPHEIKEFDKDPSMLYLEGENTPADQHSATWIARNFKFNSAMDTFMGKGYCLRNILESGRMVYGNEFNIYKAAYFKRYLINNGYSLEAR